MSRYADRTEVPADRSRAEIERTLTRYGASAFMYGWEEGHALVQFEMHDRFVRFELPMPDPDDRAFTHHSRGRRTPESARAAHEQATRQRWRALSLVVKAKLEVVESGITTFEQEFLAHLVLPDGTSFGAWAVPQITAAYETGQMPRRLLELPPPSQEESGC